MEINFGLAVAGMQNFILLSEKISHVEGFQIKDLFTMWNGKFLQVYLLKSDAITALNQVKLCMFTSGPQTI